MKSLNLVSLNRYRFVFEVYYYYPSGFHKTLLIVMTGSAGDVHLGMNLQLGDYVRNGF